MNWLRNPWGKPRFLPLVTGLYIFWSIIPVVVAVLFAFNDGRSRTTWQGFSTRWFYGDPGERPRRPSAPLGSPAHAAAGRAVRRRGRAARRRARARASALARARGRRRQHADAAPARDAGARHGRRAPAPLPPDLQRLGPGHDRAGDRAGDLRDLVRRRHRPRPAGDDRAGPGGGRRRPRARRRSRGSRGSSSRCSRRRSSRAPASSSRSRSTTSSSRSTSLRARTRTPCRCCSTRPPAAHRPRR